MPNVDSLTGAAIVMELPHERVHAGKTFQISYKSPEGAEIADDGSIEILIIVGVIPVHFTFSTTAGGNLEMELFENVTVSNNGSGLSIIGMNRQRSLAPTVTAFLSPTITADGDRLLNNFDSRGAGITTPEARDDTEWVLRPSTNYLIRSINRAGGARDMAVMAQWYQAL